MQKVRVDEDQKAMLDPKSPLITGEKIQQEK